LQSQWDIPFECLECPITVVLDVFLDLSPEEFNKIKFTVELGQKKAKVAGIFNGFSNK